VSNSTDRRRGYCLARLVKKIMKAHITTPWLNEIFYLSIVLLLLMTHPVRPSPANSDLAELVKLAEHEAVDLTAPSDLHHSEPFRLIRDDPERFADAAKELLTSQKLSKRQKMILVYAMQGLPWNTYLELLNSAAVAFKNGDIDDSVVELMICPGTDWSTRVVSKYADPKVVNLLLRIAATADTPLQNLINRILTGEIWKGAQQFPWSKLDH